MTSDHPLLEALCAGTLPRREFVRRALAAGVGGGALASLLAACGPAERGDETIPAELERDLTIYNWADYIGEDTVAGFERETGVRVVYDTYESNEDLLARLQAGATGYDLVVPTGYAIEVLRATDLLAPLHREHLPNWGNLAPLFQDSVFDPGSAYSVPWQWGTTGIAYRTDLVPEPPAGWGVFHDRRYARRMTQMDDPRDVIGAWLRYRGHSINSTDRPALQSARDDALVAKRLLKAYVSAPVKAQLIVGDVWIAQLWNGDTVQAQAEQPALAYVLPQEGSTIWADYLVIPRSAPHKRAAHEFMNYALRPEVAAAVSRFTGYGTPNVAAAGMLDRPVPYPTAGELGRLEYQHDLGAATALWDQTWTEIKSG